MCKYVLWVSVVKAIVCTIGVIMQTSAIQKLTKSDLAHRCPASALPNKILLKGSAKASGAVRHNSLEEDLDLLDEYHADAYQCLVGAHGMILLQSCRARSHAITAV